MKLFRKLFSCLVACGIASGCITAAQITAVNDAPADGGFTMEQIEGSAVKPYITASSELLCIDEAYGQPIRNITIRVKGAEGKYAATGIHVYFDSRLEFPESVTGIYARKGEALSDLTASSEIDDSAEEFGMKGLFLCSTGSNNYGRDGVMWTIPVRLPADIHSGDVFPIDIVFRSDGTNNDLFCDYKGTAEGKLMQAFTFTRGIYNNEENYIFQPSMYAIDECPSLYYLDRSYDGYIAIYSEKVTTTAAVTTTRATTTKATTTTRTTTAAKPTSTASARPTTTASKTTTRSATTTKTTTSTRPTTTRTETSDRPVPTTTTRTTAKTTPVTTAVPGISFIITPSELKLNEGASGKLTPAGAADPSKIIWSSSNSIVASVSDDGTVTAKSEGTAVIYGVYNGAMASCNVTVKKVELISGDANCDGRVSIADATAILQHMANQDKYGLSDIGMQNADVVGKGDGVSGLDAITIQMVDAGLLKASDLPLEA